MTARQIWEIDDCNRIIDGSTKVLLFTVDTSSDDDPLPIMRKIAAAPAMYEALSDVPLPSCNGDKAEWYARFYAWYCGARQAAIAQAEGREG